MDTRYGGAVRARARLLALAATLLATTTLSGCMTLLLGSAPNQKYTTVPGPELMRDTILGMAAVDPALAASTGLPDGAAVLYGQSHSYVVGLGSGQLLQALSQLDPARLSIEPYAQGLFLRDQVVWGDVRLVYRLPEGEALGAEDIRRLQGAGLYDLQQGRTERLVSLQARLAPALPASAIPAPQGAPWVLVLSAPPTTQATPNFGKFVLMPVAVLGDIVAAPLEVLGLGASALGLGQ